jgi:hypothetical protein
MELCSSGHTEVAYEGRRCPVCKLLSDHAAEVEELTNKIENFDKHVAEEREIAQNYKNKWKASEEEVTRLCSGKLDGER